MDAKGYLVRDAIEWGVVRMKYVKSGGGTHVDLSMEALDAKTCETHARFILNARLDQVSASNDST